MTKSFDCNVCGKSYANEGTLARHTCKPPTFTCQFCNKQLLTETGLINHICEQKRRYLHRDNKTEKLAFIVYQHFLRVSLRQTASQTNFARSRLYAAFVRFARHLMSLEVSNPLAFVDFLLRIEQPIDRWTKPEIYARYIRELNKNETPLEAIERNFMLMEQWAISTGENWRDFFRRIPPPQAVLWIIGGRISPWLLLTASSATDLTKRLNAEQGQMIDKAIDTDFWQAKIARHRDEVEMIRAMLAERDLTHERSRRPAGHHV